jgi:hypothetical protein
MIISSCQRSAVNPNDITCTPTRRRIAGSSFSIEFVAKFRFCADWSTC